MCHDAGHACVAESGSSLSAAAADTQRARVRVNAYRRITYGETAKLDSAIGTSRRELRRRRQNRPGVHRAAHARIERYGIEAQPEPRPRHAARPARGGVHGLSFLLLLWHFRQSGASQDNSYSSLCDSASAAFPAVLLHTRRTVNRLCEMLLCVGEPPIKQSFECESCSLPRCCCALRA